MALHLVQILLPDLAPHEAHIVLPPSLLHCFASGLANAKSDLHPTADQLVGPQTEAVLSLHVVFSLSVHAGPVHV